MKRSALTLLLSLLLNPLFSADGFTSIFNGKDLSGWDSKPGCWEVRDGEIWCTGISDVKNWLVWREDQPEDFVLKMEFRWERGNSGVQVRSEDLGEWMIYGYQVEVASQEKMGLWHHSLLDKESPKREARHLMALAGEEVTIDKSGKKTLKQIAGAEETKAHFKETEWNTMEIIADGATLTQKINDVVFSIVTDYDSELSRRKGFIALQDHGKGCNVAFRNIELKKN